MAKIKPFRNIKLDSRKFVLHTIPRLAIAVALVTILGCGDESEINKLGSQSPDNVRKTASRTEKKEKSNPHLSPQQTVVSAETQSTPGDKSNPTEKQPKPIAATKSKKDVLQNSKSKIVLPRQRPSDDRPVHNLLRLEKLGIRKYESKRLKLYTDLDPKIAKTLPSIIDQAYGAWIEYFGELPPNAEKTEFQITGYVMKNRDLFQNAGLIPKDLRPFRSGQHKGLEFWMYDQKYDYYRKHLLIHEATHCFMYQTRSADFPGWYMEGMAEFFGVHSVDTQGNYDFGVMPFDEENFLGFGRIQIVRNDFKEGKWIAFPNVRTMNHNDYLSTSGYAWSWAMCQFLDTHPKYRSDFRALSNIDTAAEFQREYHRRFLSKQKDLGTEWLLYAMGLQEGFDIESSAIDFRDGVPLEVGKTSSEIRVNAKAGWQSSGIEVEKGKTYEIVASGSFSLANKPKPWISESQGVSIIYFDGKPLGRLLAAIHPQNSSAEIAEGKLPQMSKTISVGRGLKFEAPATGTLYFRVNDSWSKLTDNSGTVSVRVKKHLPAK